MIPKDQRAYEKEYAVLMTWAGFLAAEQDVADIHWSLQEINRCVWMLSSLLMLHAENISERLALSDFPQVFASQQATLLFHEALRFGFPVRQTRALIKAAFQQSALLSFDTARNLPVFRRPD